MEGVKSLILEVKEDMPAMGSGCSIVVQVYNRGSYNSEEPLRFTIPIGWDGTYKVTGVVLTKQ